MALPRRAAVTVAARDTILVPDIHGAGVPPGGSGGWCAVALSVALAIVVGVVAITAPLSQSVLLWRNAVVAAAHNVQGVAAELNAAQQEAWLCRPTPFLAVFFFLIIVVVQVGNLT